MYYDSKVMEQICDEKIRIPHLCYRFKVSLIDSPEIFKFYDIPIASVFSFIQDFFFDKDVFRDKKLEIIGLFNVS